MDPLTETLPQFEIRALGHEDVEYAHELQCQVGSRTYCVTVAYDWVKEQCWEVFRSPTLRRWAQLRGQSEDDELKRLATAVFESLRSLPGIHEQRWYPR